jgi:hypothetical protein
MKKEDLTILIQGPFNETSISNIDEYLKFGKVVISTWDDDNPPPVLKIPKGEESNVKLISRRLPPKNEWDSRWDGQRLESPFPWAWQSTMTGLENIDTKYTIKTRSDEKFVNLQPMIDLHEKTDKLIWGNIWAKIWDKQPHHIGDHIFMDKTERLMKTYKKIYESPDLNVGSHTCESILSISYMRCLGLNENSKEDAMSVYEVMDIDEFDDWTIRHGHFKKIFNKKEHPNLNRNASSYGIPHHHDDCRDTIEFFKSSNFKLK